MSSGMGRPKATSDCKPSRIFMAVIKEVLDFTDLFQNSEISFSESEKLKISDAKGKDLDRKKSLSETVADESENDSLTSQTHTLIKREPMVKEDIHNRNKGKKLILFSFVFEYDTS